MTTEVGGAPEADAAMPAERSQGNPDVAALKQETEKKSSALPKPLQDSYQSTVTAGMRLMWDDSTHQHMEQYLQGVKSPQQVPKAVAHLILKGIQLIIEQANIKADLGDPFYAASMLAAQYLMCDALDYVEQKLGIPITKDLIAATTQELFSGLYKMYGIDQKKVQDAMQFARDQYAKHVRKARQRTKHRPSPQPAGLLNRA